MSNVSLPEPDYQVVIGGHAFKIHSIEAIRAHAAAVSAADNAALRERVKVLEETLTVALTLIGHPDDEITKALRAALEQKP